MSTQRWWKRLDRWVRSQGLSREEVVRRSGHELGHVLPYFESSVPGGRLRLFLDLVEAAGGKLSALAGNDVAAVVEYIDLVREEIKMPKSWLAEAAGLHRPHLTRILKSRLNMAIETFDELVTALGLWDDLEIVPRVESVELAQPVAVGGEHWTGTNGGGSSTRSTRGPRRLAVVDAPSGPSRGNYERDSAVDQLQEMKEKLERAEQERDEALARAERAEKMLAQRKKRVEKLEAQVDELETRVEEERERGDVAEQEAAEAAQSAQEEAERADEATARAVNAEQWARQEVQRAHREHAKAEDEKRRAAGLEAQPRAERTNAATEESYALDLEAQLRAERTNVAKERSRADAAEQQLGRLVERLQSVEAALRTRPEGSSWWDKLGWVAVGVAGDRAAIHLSEYITAKKAEKPRT